MEKDEKSKEVKKEEVKKTEITETTKKPENEKPKEEKKAEFKKVETTKAKETKPTKSTAKPTQTKKSGDKKKTGGYWIAGVVVLILVIAIVTILLVVPETPRKAVDGMFSALKSGDFNKVNEYVNYDELMKNADLADEEVDNQEVQKLFFEKLEWKINKVNEEGEKATLEVEVTNKDFKTIIANYTQKILKAAFGGQTASDEELQRYLIELLKDEQVQTATITKTIETTKQDGKWKVSTNTDLISALLPGLEDAINSLNEMSETAQ